LVTATQVVNLFEQNNITHGLLLTMRNSERSVEPAIFNAILASGASKNLVSQVTGLPSLATPSVPASLIGGIGIGNITLVDM
jgi:hypothetical protein